MCALRAPQGYDECRDTSSESDSVPTRQIMKKSRSIQLFKPKAPYQATWANLGNELMQSLNSMSLDQLADSTVLLLRAMGYMCEMVPTKLILSSFKVRLVGSELVRWKRKIKEVFGVQGGAKSLAPLNRRTQVIWCSWKKRDRLHYSMSKSCEKLKTWVRRTRRCQNLQILNAEFSRGWKSRRNKLISTSNHTTAYSTDGVDSTTNVSRGNGDDYM